MFWDLTQFNYLYKISVYLCVTQILLEKLVEELHEILYLVAS